MRGDNNKIDPQTDGLLFILAIVVSIFMHIALGYNIFVSGSVSIVVAILFMLLLDLIKK